jgi:hypothetical protein
MGARENFLDRFEELWPKSRVDIEKNIFYAERTGESVYSPRYYSITPSDGWVKAEIYNGGKTLSVFRWPLQDPAEMHRNMLIAEYLLRSGFHG